MNELQPARTVEKRRHAACPLCSSRRSEHRFEVKGFSLLRCRDCTLLYVGELLTNEELSVYYGNAEDGHVYTDDNVVCLNYYYEQVKSYIEKSGRRTGRVLDVGCSGGFFLDLMSGWERHGTELSPTVAEVARAKHGDRIFLGSLENYPERAEYFDVITLQDVLDHCIDPMAAIEKCKRMLKPGGLLVIKVHDIECLYAKVTGPRFYAILPPFHLFYFSRRTLQLLLDRQGLKAERFAHLAHLLQVRTVFHRLARGSTDNVFYRAYQLLDNPIGAIRIRKNLHDLITVFATKPA